MAQAARSHHKRLKRDILWRETFGYNSLRAAFCGLVWSIITHGMPEAIHPLIAPLAWVVTYYLIAPFAYLIGNVLGWLGLILSAALSLFFVTLGDPFVWLLGRVAPQLVPVERPALFSFRALILVTVPEKQKPLPEIELPTAV